jgi:hypothetical protein
MHDLNELGKLVITRQGQMTCKYGLVVDKNSQNIDAVRIICSSA